MDKPVHIKGTTTRQLLITSAALIYVIVLIALLYDKWLIFFDFFNFLFSSKFIFWGGILAGGGLGIYALLKGSQHSVLRICLAIGLVIVAAFPALLPVLYEPYSPAASPTSGYEMIWLTAPTGRWNSSFLTAQGLHEKSGCTYILNGWTQDNVLYYSSSCEPGYWRFDPAVDVQPQSVEHGPGNIVSQVISGVSAERSLHSSSASIGLGYTYQHDFILCEVARSTDGLWTAAIVRYYYGPQDVIILSQEGETSL